MRPPPFLAKVLARLRRSFQGPPPKPARAPDPRVDADPWLAALFDDLGERYALGKEVADGFQITRRTGKARFNPMRTYLRPREHGVVGDYDVRVTEGFTLEQGRALLDRKVTRPLRELGLKPSKESVEEWGGQVITRRYEGACPDALAAARAVRFLCEKSEQVMNVAAE